MPLARQVSEGTYRIFDESEEFALFLLFFDFLFFLPEFVELMFWFVVLVVPGVLPLPGGIFWPHATGVRQIPTAGTSRNAGLFFID